MQIFFSVYYIILYQIIILIYSILYVFLKTIQAEEKVGSLSKAFPPASQVFGLLCNAWLPNSVSKWIGGLKFKQTTQGTGDQDADEDPALTSVQQFAKISGKRAARTKEFLHELHTTGLGFKLVLLAIVDEPIRFLQCDFLGFSKSGNRNALWHFSNPEVSPLTAVTQYLASLLCCTEGFRLSLLFGREGYVDVGAWERSRPDQIRTLRRMVLLANSWVQRRHCDRLFDMPWALCSLADPEVSETRKETLINMWDSSLGCCVRPGLARQLKARGVTGDDLLHPQKLWFCLEKCFFLVPSWGIHLAVKLGFQSVNFVQSVF